MFAVLVDLPVQYGRLFVGRARGAAAAAARFVDSMMGNYSICTNVKVGEYCYNAPRENWRWMFDLENIFHVDNLLLP